MEKNLAIVLVSGGMDSLACAAIAKKENEELAFLHLNYGQRTESKELECFHAIADHYHVSQELRKVIDLSFLSQIGGSSLTDKNIEVKDYKGDSGEIPDSYVPFRNTIILSFAVSWAEVLGAKRIYIGAVHEDSSGYPDCRPSFYKAFTQVIKEGTKNNDISIVTPVISMSKDQIIKTAADMGAPLEKTWSCYAKEDKACGVCDSCALRLRAFEKIKMEDPIPYAKRPKYT